MTNEQRKKRHDFAILAGKAAEKTNTLEGQARADAYRKAAQAYSLRGSDNPTETLKKMVEVQEQAARTALAKAQVFLEMIEKESWL